MPRQAAARSAQGPRVRQARLYRPQVAGARARALPHRAGRRSCTCSRWCSPSSPRWPGPAPSGPSCWCWASLPVIAREYRLASEPNPLVDWVPESFYPPYVVAAYASLTRGAGAADAGVQHPAAAVDRRHPAGDAGPVVQGVLAPERRGPPFEPRQLIRGQRVLALAGVAVCLLAALLFTWTVEGEVAQAAYRTAAERVRAGELRRPRTRSTTARRCSS